jgi:hypothetical protein
LAIAVLVGTLQAAQPTLTTPRELLEAMRARYEGKWYRTITFEQHNTEHHPDGTIGHSVWREWLEAPGRLRIEIQPPDSGNGTLIAQDSLFFFRHDSLIRALPFVHPLLVLGFDLYMQPVQQTMAQLDQRRFDLTVLSEGVWQGRPAWIVGAKAGDLRTRQFWVDKERLVFVRLVEPAQRDTAKTADTRFNKYVPLAGGWIAPEVEFLIDGQRTFLEEYKQIQANVTIPAAFWDARQWKAARRLTP